LSALEDDFHALWKVRWPQLELIREFSDVPQWESDYQERYAKSKRSKRYRADFAHVESQSLIEIQGGTYMRGRHVTGSGYERDARKYNLAMMSGWKVYLLTSTTAKDAAWIEKIGLACWHDQQLASPAG
jgi:hypothetical protein